MQMQQSKETTEAELIRQQVFGVHFYYKKLETSRSRKLTPVIRSIENCLTKVDQTLTDVDFIASRINEFDPHPDIKTNGYRSLLKFYSKCLAELVDLISLDSSGFQPCRSGKKEHLKNITAWTNVVTEMTPIIHLAADYLRSSDSLLVDRFCLSDDTMNRLIHCVLTTKAVYGRAVAFQYPNGLKKPMMKIVSTMSTFNYSGRSKGECQNFLAHIFPKQSKCTQDAADERAVEVHKRYLVSRVRFCNALFSAVEKYTSKKFNHQLREPVSLTKWILLPNKPIMLTNRSLTAGNEVQVSSADLPTSTLPVVIMSNRMTHGSLAQLGITEKELEFSKGVDWSPPRTILLHLHGGGFIAESFSAEEVYMCKWAKSLNIPIIGVHYALSPSVCFPHEAEECFYAYIWTLESRPLGWTGERIIVTGDSAGGNLAASICIKAIMNGIRTPDILFCLYPVFNLSGHQSPSRLLSLIDPFLNFGLLQVCSLAYSGYFEGSTEGPSRYSDETKGVTHVPETTADFERLGQAIKHEIDYLANSESMLSPGASPIFVPDDILRQFPFTYLFGCQSDPLLDDSIIMAKRFTVLGVDHKFVSVQHAPHCYISMRLADKVCDEAHSVLLDTLSQCVLE